MTFKLDIASAPYGKTFVQEDVFLGSVFETCGTHQVFSYRRIRWMLGSFDSLPYLCKFHRKFCVCKWSPHISCYFRHFSSYFSCISVWTSKKKRLLLVSNKSETYWHILTCMFCKTHDTQVHSPRSGVPKLSLAMYPFSISIHEHVPLNMGAGLGFFSREGSVVDFPPFLQKYEKMSNFKIRGGVGPLFDAHVPKTSYDKKAEGITKMYLSISM